MDIAAKLMVLVVGVITIIYGIITKNFWIIVPSAVLFVFSICLLYSSYNNKQ